MAASAARHRRAFLGALAVAVTTFWLVGVGLGSLAGDGDLMAVLRAAVNQMVGPAYLVVLAVIVSVERRWPAVRRPLFNRAARTDLAYLALFATGVIPFLVLLQAGFSLEVQRHASFLILNRMPLVPELLVVVAIVVAMDAMNWGAHAANHRSSALWRFHALHHSQEEMSVLTTFRTHPFTHLSYLPSLLPAIALGASGAVPGAALIAYACLVTLPHANVPWSFGRLGRVFVSPAFHQLHHARVPLDERGTVNFGFVFVWWDRWAGLAAFPTDTWVATGLPGRPVPVEQALGTRLGTVVARQLFQPLSLASPTDVAP